MTEVIVCDSIAEFQKRYKKVNGKRSVLCLTKNAELSLECSQLYGDVVAVDFLECKRNAWEYEEQTRDILDRINTCISHVIPDRSYIYHANYHLEGVTEAAQVLEILMLQDLFNELLLKYKDVNLYCYYNVIYAKEIEMLYFWCRRHNLKFHLDYGKTNWEFVKLRLAILNIFGEKALEQMSKLYAFIKGITYIESMKRQMRMWGRVDNLERNYNVEVGIVKQSAREKDYNWTKGYLDDLSEASIHFRFICMTEEVKKKWESFGYEADNIQRSLRIDLLNSELKKYKCNKKRVWKELRTFLKKEELGNILQLRLIMRSHLEYGVLRDVINDVAAGEFFKTHKYKIIDLHTSTGTAASKILSFNAREYDGGVKIRIPTVFPFTRAFSLYEPYGYLADFCFVPKDTKVRVGKALKKRSLRQYVVKHMSYSKDFCAKSFERELLSDELRVVWAPSYPTMWQGCHSSFLHTGLTLIDFFCENSGEMSIKFHPNQRKAETVIFEKKAVGQNNIVVEPLEKNIRQVLAKADILITNCSLSSLDAVVERKAVICVVNEREYKLIERHKKGIYIIKDHHELINLFKKLSEDQEYRKNWIEERVKIQEEYFAQIMADTEENKKIIEIMKKELTS